MSIAYIRYPLEKGYIHTWLVGGPQAIPVEDLARFSGPNAKLEILRAYTMADSGITALPVERGSLADGVFQVGDFEGAWRLFHCLEDHFVDLTAFYHTTHYLRAWAYAQIESPEAQTVPCVLTTNGPADIWVNGVHIHRHEHLHHQPPASVPAVLPLQPGSNAILVRFEAVAARACPFVMALQLSPELASSLQVAIPTAIRDLPRRNKLERVFQAAYLDRDVFDREEEITVHWPKEMGDSASITLRLQRPNGQIYAEGNRMAAAGAHIATGFAYQHPEGELKVVLMPRSTEYYEGDMRVSRELPLRSIGNNRYAESPVATYPERRREALLTAARYPDSLFAQIARMAIGWWSRLELDLILKAIEGINQRQDCSDFYLAGLLGMLYRFGSAPKFPEELRAPLESCILGFKYWMDEPGSDAMAYLTENHSILFHTCEILAGQLYPDRLFTNNGETGAWHRAKGERLALAWLRERGMHGFKEWDSNCYFEEDVLALSHLVDLAETDAVWELASVVLDKLLFTMALNSFKGVFGSTHGRTYAPLIRGGLLESTAGIGWLMWGQGVLNGHIMGTVSLACADNYELPELIRAIATDLPEELWSRERHSGAPELWRASGSLGPEVNKVTYKTPDTMLCSAQDYHPGERGFQQHIWQATLGRMAAVFVTHPPCSSDAGSHRPNFWHGNVILPRVAQWKDTLIAIHKLPEDDWMGFTHAYFPVHAFDAYVMRESPAGAMWAFARKGEGYLALTASGGLDFITQGLTAYRELRSYQQHAVWLCCMGRAALDGDFDAFQARVLAMPLAFGDLSLRCQTLRGDRLEFAWEGPFLRNDQSEPLSGYRHYDSIYCQADLPAAQMEIRFADTLMRLKFAEEEGEPDAPAS